MLLPSWEWKHIQTCISVNFCFFWSFHCTLVYLWLAQECYQIGICSSSCIMIRLLDYLTLECLHLIYKVSNEPFYSIPSSLNSGFHFRKLQNNCQFSSALTSLLWRQVRDLHGFGIFFDRCENNPQQRSKNDTQLTSLCNNVAPLLANPHVYYWWGPTPATHGPESLYLSLFSSSIGKTKGVCQTEQLFMCDSPHVTALWPHFSGTQETSDIVVPTVHHSSLTHPSNFSIKENCHFR